MEITITKNEFEKALPVGTSANEGVLEAVMPAISDQVTVLSRTMLGLAGQTYMEQQGPSSEVVRSFKKLVALKGFLSVLRQLDLVLTPTGFGVVSNQNLTPASSQRVNALEGQLRTEYLKALGTTLHLLRSENWGSSPQAKLLIGHLYDVYTFFHVTHEGATYTDWKAFTPSADDADEFLRSWISNAQMNAFLDAYRRADPLLLEQYQEAIDLVVKVTDAYATMGASVVKAPVFRRLMRHLDSDDNQELFKPYRQSREYKANHHEPFRNKQDSAGYLFNG